MRLDEIKLPGIVPVPITRLDLKLSAERWAFAEAERVRIAEHWRKLSDANPRIWNGDVLISSHAAIRAQTLSARFLKSDYASFVAWRDWGRPDAGVSNVFGSAIVHASDRALIYGRMSAHTLNPNMVYPPGGSLEMRDVGEDGEVDVLGSLTRELEEETGLDPSLAEKGELLAVIDDHRLSVAQVFRFAQDAEALAEEIRHYLRSGHEDELSDVVIMRPSSEIDSTMLPYAVAIAQYLTCGGD
jgi:8-oxo-dGTP pyrophosphatase MutT (NUDIX family)